MNFQTLQKYVTKQRANPNQDIAMTPEYKSRLIINEEEESSLVDYIILQCVQKCVTASLLRISDGWLLKFLKLMTKLFQRAGKFIIKQVLIGCRGF